jgi:hypothetical protein
LQSCWPRSIGITVPKVSTAHSLKAVALAGIAFAAILLVPGSVSAASPESLSWTVTAVKPVPKYGVPSEISGESCPSANLCVAVTVTGDVLTSTDPTEGASAWTVSDADDAIGIDALSCVGSDLCVAVDTEGDVLTSTDPGTSGVGSWTITPVG